MALVGKMGSRALYMQKSYLLSYLHCLFSGLRGLVALARAGLGRPKLN
jgi:hypothetical protein